MDYTLTISDTFNAALVAEVVRFNRSRPPGMLEITTGELLLLWVEARIRPLIHAAQEQERHARHLAYEAAPAEKQAEANAAIGFVREISLISETRPVNDTIAVEENVT